MSNYTLTIVTESQSKETESKLKTTDTDAVRIAIDDFMKAVIVNQTDFIQITALKQ